MDMKTIGIIVLVAAFAALIYVEVQKRSTFAKLEHYMAERDFDNYLAVLDRPVTNILYPEYNRLFLRLNAYLGMGDNENTARVLDKMMTLRMSKEQKLALAIKGFSFFVEVEDKPKAERMLAILEEDGGEGVARRAVRRSTSSCAAPRLTWTRWSASSRTRPRWTRPACITCSRCSTRIAATRRSPRSTRVAPKRLWRPRLSSLWPQIAAFARVPIGTGYVFLAPMVGAAERLLSAAFLCGGRVAGMCSFNQQKQTPTGAQRSVASRAWCEIRLRTAT